VARNSNSGYGVVHVWSEHGGGAACGYAPAKALINSRAIVAGVYLEQPFPVCCTCIDIVKGRFACQPSFTAGLTHTERDSIAGTPEVR
jgi:hypothetical protein